MKNINYILNKKSFSFSHIKKKQNLKRITKFDNKRNSNYLYNNN